MCTYPFPAASVWGPFLRLAKFSLFCWKYLPYLRPGFLLLPFSIWSFHGVPDFSIFCAWVFRFNIFFDFNIILVFYLAFDTRESGLHVWSSVGRAYSEVFDWLPELYSFPVLFPFGFSLVILLRCPELFSTFIPLLVFMTSLRGLFVSSLESLP